MSLTTWNPNDKSSYILLENNNMTAIASTTFSNLRAIRATKSIDVGRWYFEVKIVELSGYVHLGISNRNANLTAGTYSSPEDKRVYRFGSGVKGGEKYGGSIKQAVYGEGSVSGDIVGVAVDTISGTIEFLRNGISMGVAFNDINELNDKFVFLEISIPGRINANFGSEVFDITRQNINEWNKLVSKGYKPYDVDNAQWFGYNHLIKQGSDYYTTNNNYYKLGEPTDKIELKKWLSEYGANNILNLQDSYNNKIVPVDKFSESRKIYESLDVDFNDVKKPYISMIDIDSKKRLDYDTDNYKIIDEIRKINNGIGNVVFKEY